MVEQLAICLFARGHALLMGVPGLAKTLLVSSVAEMLDLSFNRIQFTPDLMPADITGTDIIQESGAGGRREFEFVRGPVFSNIILADEINRAPAKTQSALLEAMQEHKVTVLGTTYTLKPPFFVLATQNPIEQEGTYPLPEAQLDRFMFLIEIDYPTAEEEKRIARETTGAGRARALPHARRPQGARLPATRAPRPGARPHLRLRRRNRPHDPPRPTRGAARGSANSSAGAPARAPCNTSSSAPRPAPPCTAPTWCAWKTSRRSPPRSSPTA